VTGSVQGQLGVYLFDNGFLDITDGRCVFQAEQGDAIGRRGRVTIELNINDHKSVSVKVGGNAVTVMDGEMIVHD
jgi:PhzF family phenazine biosynthesis protein